MAIQKSGALAPISEKKVATRSKIPPTWNAASDPMVIAAELDRYLPFLTTTKVLMASVRKGVGREEAHEAIKENAVAAVLEMRESGTQRNGLFDRLAADERLGLSRDELDALVSAPLELTGAAGRQVERVVQRVRVLAEADPEAAAYQPGAVL